MALSRVIGRWALSGLVVNCIIGAGIFGLPGELNRSLGVASPLVMVFGALVMAIIMACAAEVGSQFAESGGAYLYVRRAFGRFAGLQVACFWMLAMLAGVAGSANVFLSYLGGLIPALAAGTARGLTMAVLIAIPTVINCLGVRSGAAFSGVLAIAKLLPLAVLIVLGLGHSFVHPTVIHESDMVAPGWSGWLSASLLMVYAYGGWEDALAPSGEVKEPRRAVPGALAAALLLSTVIYTLLQYVTVATIGSAATDHPLADVATVLIGDQGRTFVSVGALLSTYGFIAGAFVNAPRLPYALANEGDAPPAFAILHPRFRTPTYAIIAFAVVSYALAISGTFGWALALSAGSMLIIFAGFCASLIQLRRTQPKAEGLRIPGGPLLAMVGMALCAVLLLQLDIRHVALMLLTACLATANWLWAARQMRHGRWKPAEVV
jgi:amino acid transporter